jgi:hypothetical protein
MAAAEECAGSVATLLGPDEGCGALDTLSIIAKLSAFLSFKESLVLAIPGGDPGDPAPFTN